MTTDTTPQFVPDARPVPPIQFLSPDGVLADGADTTPREIRSNATDLAARAPGYGMPGVSVDGNDLLAVHKVDIARVSRRGRLSW